MLLSRASEALGCFDRCDVLVDVGFEGVCLFLVAAILEEYHASVMVATFFVGQQARDKTCAEQAKM
jgi:hypothetical protein